MKNKELLIALIALVVGVALGYLVATQTPSAADTEVPADFVTGSVVDAGGPDPTICSYSVDYKTYRMIQERDSLRVLRYCFTAKSCEMQENIDGLKARLDSMIKGPKIIVVHYPLSSACDVKPVP